MNIPFEPLVLGSYRSKNMSPLPAEAGLTGLFELWLVVHHFF